MQACHDEILSQLASLSEEEQYALCKEISVEQLLALVEVMSARPQPNIGPFAFAPVNHLEAYPPGVARFMLQAAAGDFGDQYRPVALEMFRSCSDCPPEAYEPALWALRTLLEPEMISDAVGQLRYAPQDMAEPELLRILNSQEPQLRAQRDRALMRLVLRGSPHALSSIEELLDSSSVENVLTGVRGLQALSKADANYFVKHPEAEDRLATTLDSAYSVLGSEDRLAVLQALILLPGAPAHLERIATAETDGQSAKAILRAAEALRNGRSGRSVRSMLRSELQSQ